MVKVMKSTGNNAVSIESLEDRQMMSTTPIQIGTLGLAMAADKNLTELPVVFAQGQGASTMPQAFPYFLQVDHEVMEVTGKSNGLTASDINNTLALDYPVM